LAHRFEPATHRCACGRWQAGHKPKTEPVRPRAECQICERTQALDAAGCLGHHGYRRPGWGCIEGDCPGVGFRPYPATSALERYLSALKHHIASCELRLAGIDTIAELPYEQPMGYKAAAGRYVYQSVVVQRGDKAHNRYHPVRSTPAFADLEERERRRMERETAAAKREQARVEARIEKAQTILEV
jgi:hypothetical protein